MVKRKKCPGCFSRALFSYAVWGKENTPVTAKVGYGGIDPLGLFCYPPFYTVAAHRKSSCPRLSGAQKLDKISETPVFSRLSDFVPNNNIIVYPAHNSSCFHARFLPYLPHKRAAKVFCYAMENMDSIRRSWEGMQKSGWICLAAIGTCLLTGLLSSIRKVSFNELL